MKALGVLIAVVLGGNLMVPAAPAAAADLAVVPRGYAALHALPFPRSARTEAVWASGGCWTACTSVNTWALAGCLRRDAQGRCLGAADAGDRTCQRTCRTRGGPYLPLD